MACCGPPCPAPIPPGQRHRLQGVLLAGPAPLPHAAAVVQRRVSSRGGIQVARQRIQVGMTHAGKVVTVIPRDTSFRLVIDGEDVGVVPRTTSRQIDRHRATSGQYLQSRTTGQALLGVQRGRPVRCCPSVCEKVGRDLRLSSSAGSHRHVITWRFYAPQDLRPPGSTEGLVLVPVLAVAGGLLSWAQRYITGEVRDQLAAQKIYFPASNSPEMAAPEFEAVRQYAGQQLTTGDQAKVYADHFIANHLEARGGGKTYAELSGEALTRPDDPQLAAKVQLMFRGETSRGLLLNAYAFGKMGNIAGYAAIAAFAGAGVSLVFSLLGFYHASKVTPDQ